MNQLISILGAANVNFIKEILVKICETRGPEWRGDFMMPGFSVTSEDKLPEPVLDWFDTVILDLNNITVSALAKHRLSSENYPTESEISNTFMFETYDNLTKKSNGEETLSVGFHFGDRNIMQVFGIEE